MHLEELFRCIEGMRSEFIAKRAARAAFAGSVAGVAREAENNGKKSPNDEIEAELTSVAAAIGE